MTHKTPPPHVLHSTVCSEEMLSGTAADAIYLPMPAAEARLVLDLIHADLPIWEANPESRASATLTLEQATELATRLKRALVLALLESIA